MLPFLLYLNNSYTAKSLNSRYNTVILRHNGKMKASQFKKVMKSMSESAKKNLTRDGSLAMVCLAFDKQGKMTPFLMKFETEEEKINSFKTLKSFLQSHKITEFLIIGEVWCYEDKRKNAGKYRDEKFILPSQHSNRIEAIQVQGFKGNYVYEVLTPFVRTVAGFEFKKTDMHQFEKKDCRGQLAEILLS